MPVITHVEQMTIFLMQSSLCFNTYLAAISVFLFCRYLKYSFSLLSSYLSGFASEHWFFHHLLIQF